MKARAQKSSWGSHIEVLLMNFVGASDRDYVIDLVMEHNPDPSREMKPSFTLPITEAQKLMDDLWDCGLRPSEGTGSAGALAATQKHLEDMRKLVFKDA